MTDNMPKPAKIYISWVLAIAAVVFLAGLSNWECKDLTRYLGFFYLTLLGTMLKVKLPGIIGTYSLGFVFILLGIADLSLAESLLMACGSAFVQCLWRTQRKPQAIQVLFSVCNLVIDVAGAHVAFHLVRQYRIGENLIGSLALAAAVLYVLNTGLLSILLALAEGKHLRRIWEHWVIWSFPYYLAGAVLAGTFTLSSQYVDWRSCALITPMLFLVYWCYRLYVEHASQGRQSALESRGGSGDLIVGPTWASATANSGSARTARMPNSLAVDSIR